MDHASVLGQKFSRERGLASAVRTSDDDVIEDRARASWGNFRVFGIPETSK